MENNKEELNLGGFPNIIIKTNKIKKKRETSEIINKLPSIQEKQINILNIKDILKNN